MEFSLKTDALADAKREFKITRRMLERVPDEHWDWKPHEKSWTLGQLAAHIANLLTWPTMTLQTEELDISQPFPKREIPANNEALLANFDANVEEFKEELAGADDAHLAHSWPLKMGDRVLTNESRCGSIRQWGISHMVHHRGQLSVYLRLLDVPVPPSYGPTADERGM